MNGPLRSDTTNRAHWLGRAERLRLPVNFLWWLRTALPGAVTVHAGLAAGLLLFRRQHWPMAYLFSGYGVALAVVAVAAWWIARRRFLGVNDALLRLENHLGLHNRLSAALAGHAAWPDPVHSPRSAYAFHPASWAIPLALMVGLPAVAAVAPLPALSKPPAAVAAAEPPEWKEMEKWAEELKKEEAADNEAVKRLEERLEQLREENKDGMFRQGAQEATESLHAEMRNDITKLAQNLAKAGELADAIDKLAQAGRQAAPTELSDEWKEALEKLQKAGLPASPELNAALKQIAPSKLKQIDPKKLKLTKAKIAKACENCGNCVVDPDKVALMLAQCNGACNNPGPGGKSGKGPGKGGFNQHSEGEGTADINFSNTASALAPTVEALPDAKDDDSLSAGDLLAIQNRKPDDKNKPAENVSRKGGDSTFRGLGGEAVFRDRLTPEETEFLSRYNKQPEKK